MEIDISQILFQIVNFSVVLAALTFLLYKPIFKMFLERAKRIEEGQKAAQICALNCLAAVKEVIGNLDKIIEVVKLTVFVACTADFTAQPKVANGASELIGKIFGETGKHVRSAVGVTALPLNASVEIEMIIRVE